MSAHTSGSAIGAVLDRVSTSELISQDERHLKWQPLDVVEYVLLRVVGLLLAVFVTTTFLDVLTRTIGAPWLWLQEATLVTFIWGVFLGTSIAVRRNEHFYLTAIATARKGRVRLVMESFNHLVMMAVCLTVAYFGYGLFLQGFGNLLPVTHLPLAALTAAVPTFGALSTVFVLERLINGWRRGFETSE